MELYDKLTSIMIAFLISITGLAVSLLGILTVLNGNPVGYSEVSFWNSILHLRSRSYEGH